MAFDLTLLAPAVHEHADDWDSLGLSWKVGPIHPNHGKAITSATFEGSAWVAEILIWETGEADVETLRLSDEQVINKHYDLENDADLDTLVGEVLRLLRDGETPPDAYIP